MLHGVMSVFMSDLAVLMKLSMHLSNVAKAQ